MVGKKTNGHFKLLLKIYPFGFALKLTKKIHKPRLFLYLYNCMYLTRVDSPDQLVCHLCQPVLSLNSRSSLASLKMIWKYVTKIV